MPPALKPCGLFAAAYTPLDADGGVRLEGIEPLVEHLLEDGVGGLYVCGSTGEGVSLSSDERRAVAAQFVKAAAGRVPVIVQAGHNSIEEARQLAAHAQQEGADAVSATCPSYFAIDDVQLLVECMAEVARGAAELPFYYYHIPVLTGVRLDMVDFLRRGSERIENLAGLKFTDTAAHEFQRCLELDEGRYDVLWGCDQMLLSALVVGARAAVGSTYNFAAPLYRRIIAAVDVGEMAEARRLQSQAVTMIQTMAGYPFHPAMKSVMAMLDVDCGPCRLPQRTLTAAQRQQLRGELEAAGFFQWGRS